VITFFADEAGFSSERAAVVIKFAVDEGASRMLIFLACKSVRSFFLVCGP